MQKLGFNVQKNAAPAFGCENCTKVKNLLTGKGVLAETADAFITENTKPTKGGLFSKPKTHIEQAANLLKGVQAKLAYYVESLKNSINFGG